MAHSSSHSLADKSTRWIAITLRAGVWLSSLLMLAGLVMALALGPITMPDRNPSLSELLAFLSSGEILHPTARTSLLLMYAGVVCLMLTPFFRVLAALAGFVAEHDRRYAFISVLVFSLLLGQLIHSLS